VTFSNVAALQFAWNTFRTHLGPLLTLGGASLMLTMLSQALSRHGGTEFVLSVAIQLLQSALGLVLLRVSLRLHDGETVELAEPKPLLMGFWGFLLTLVVFWVAVALGFALLLVPGVWLGLVFCMAPLISAEGEKDLATCFRESDRLTRGARWSILGMWLMLAGLNLLGVLALGVGVVVTVPLSALCIVYAYRALQGRQPASADAPPFERRSESLSERP
jgi:hypothetical protein